VTSEPMKMTHEEYKNEVKRVESLLVDCLELNKCLHGASSAALFSIIMNDFLFSKYPWEEVEGIFSQVLEQAKPFFVKES
jgi:hypothetical protein